MHVYGDCSMIDAPSATAEPQPLAVALAKIGAAAESDWAKEETCYKTLLVLVRNGQKYAQAVKAGGADAIAATEKFRRISAGNEKIRERVLDIDGGADVLLAAGFAREGNETSDFVLVEVEQGVAPPYLEFLELAEKEIDRQAQQRMDENFRKERDAKIAKAKADEAALNQHGTFARGLHNLKSTAAKDNAD